MKKDSLKKSTKKVKKKQCPALKKFQDLHKNLEELIDENRKSVKTLEKFKQKCVNFKAP